MAQVLQFPPAQYAAPQTYGAPQPQIHTPITLHQGPNGMLLPSFPAVATRVDGIAKRVPWYVWLGLGSYLMYRVLKRTA